MKIDRSSFSSSAPIRRKGKTESGDGGFAANLAGSEETGTASAVPGQTGVSNLESLLALQEVPDAHIDRDKARQRGARLLDRLEEIRLSLLEGRLSVSSLERLAEEVGTARAKVDDPKLDEILDEIDLRAQVELAKLGR